MQFEQLVKQAICNHEFKPICIKDKANKERRRKNAISYYHKHKDEPEFIHKRKETQKKSRNTDEYRKHHAEEMRIWRAKQSPEWKQKEIQRLRKHNTKQKQNKPTMTFNGLKISNVKLIKGNQQ